MINEDHNNLISIVLPTYNRGYVLEKAINSVINQTYDNWELIVVDDASVDNTKDVMGRFSDSRIKYICESQNRGANYCRNLGVNNSKGNYIAFLDSDNYWEKNKLEVQLKEINAAEDDVAFVFCKEIVCDGLKQYYVPIQDYSEEEISNLLFKENIIDTSTVLIKKACFVQVGGFDEKMPRIQDWELFFRIINVYRYKVKYISKCLNSNILQKNSISKDGKKLRDAIFYFLNKYPDKFNNAELIRTHIRRAFSVENYEDQCKLCEKIYQNYSCNADVMKGLMQDLLMQLHKQKKFFSLLYDWKLKGLEQMDDLFNNYFNKEEMEIAIYGLGKWGELIYHELKKYPVNILYGIDREVLEFHSLQVKKPTDELEKVDFIIVSTFWEFEEIKMELQKKYQGEIISIETLIREA